MDGSSIFFAEGRFPPFYYESSISSHFLQAIDYLGSRQRIRYQKNEFAKASLFTRLADFEMVWFDDTLQNKPVVQKSSKDNFISFRNVGIFHKDFNSRIFIDLNQLRKSEELLSKTRHRSHGVIYNTKKINSNE